MKKRLLARMHILVLLLCIGADLFAQKRTITGRITDAKDGSPLQGVSVQPKGSLKNGTLTGADGTFTLSVDPGTKILVYSFIGYASQEQPIGQGLEHVALTAGSSSLNEIVVIGYGTTRKK